MGDEPDWGEAVRLYDHCIDHTLKHLSYGDLSHGDSIAIGISTKLSILLSITNFAMLQRHYTILRKLGLLRKVPPKADPRQIWDQSSMTNTSSKARCIQPFPSIGVVARTAEGAFTHGFDMDTVLQAIRINQSRMGSNVC